jgi:hypothetical protein
MMKFITLLASLFVALLASAQPPSYDDLKIYYADEDFEKLVSKAMKYTDKDKTKKDPIPYIWVAKGLYKISVSGNDDPDYKNAFKDGIKYIGKAMKYDEDGTASQEHDEFLRMFTMRAVELIVNDCDAGDYRKAYGWNVKYLSIAKDKAGSKYMEGACKHQNSDKGGANTAWKEADEMLEEVKSLESWREADKTLLMRGVMESAGAMISSRQGSKAKELMDRFAPWFEENSDFKALYDEIING